MSWRRAATWTCLAIVLTALAPREASAQCAMCRRALDSPEGRQMIAAFRSGILVLLAAPFSVFGLIAVLARRMARRRERISKTSETPKRCWSARAETAGMNSSESSTGVFCNVASLIARAGSVWWPRSARSISWTSSDTQFRVTM